MQNSHCKRCKAPIAVTKQSTAVYCSESCKLRSNRAKHNNNREALRRGNGDYLPFDEREWEKMKRRFNYCCAYCGKPKPLERDHVIPLSRGGRHAIANIVPACRRCNQQKKDKLLIEWKLSKIKSS